MKERKTEGLLLHSIPYLENKKILKVLTAQDGLISVIVKKKALLSFTDPFLIAEWVIQKKKSDVYELVDASIKEDFSSLRNRFATLFAAGEIAKDLLHIELPEKTGSGPYLLTVAFLRNLASFCYPSSAVASFRLKLLTHEGFLSFSQTCRECSLPSLFLEKGESKCKDHAAPGSVPFNQEEMLLIQHLSYLKYFREIDKSPIPNNLEIKIKKIFYNITN